MPKQARKFTDPANRDYREVCERATRYGNARAIKYVGARARVSLGIRFNRSPREPPALSRMLYITMIGGVRRSLDAPRPARIGACSITRGRARGLSSPRWSKCVNLTANR